MNIAIVTQPLWGNYGGLIQNYALQQILIELGHNPITLDYMTVRMPFVKHSSTTGGKILSKIFGFLKEIGVGKTIRWDNPKVKEFIKYNLKTTQILWNYYPDNILEKYNIDAIIVGSDQVWRPKYNKAIEDMFLKFCKNNNIKRIAYAASFGCEELEFTADLLEKCSELLKKFDGVSVRESSGLSLLSRFDILDGELVADPTILLGREGFDKILSKRNDVENEYLGCYILDSSSEIQNYIKNESIRLDVTDIIQINEKSNEIGPIEWINMIKNAKYVITDSFHGMVMCILYHIPFKVIVNSLRGASRFKSLLAIVDLQQCLVEADDIKEEKEVLIDWIKVDEKLGIFRENSINFLRRNLKE